MAHKPPKLWEGLFYGVVGAAILLWPQFLNGFPIVFSDTEGYFASIGKGLVFTDYRSPVYNLFCSLLHTLTMRVWPISLVQVCIATWLIFVFCRCTLTPWKPIGTVYIVVLLSAFTYVGWIAGEIMPDISTAYALLCCFLLLFYSQALSVYEKIALWIIFPLNIICHLSNVPVFLAALVIFGVIRWRRCSRGDLWRIGLLAAIIVLSFFAVQLGIYKRLAAANTTSTFLMARMMEDHLTTDSIDDLCSKSLPLKLCAHKGELEALKGYELLWRRDYSPLFGELGGWKDTNGEFTQVVLHSFRLYPWRNLDAAMINTGRSFFLFGTRTDPSYEPQDAIGKLIAYQFPKDLAAYNNSLQQRNLLLTVALLFQPLYHFVLIFSLAGGAFLALRNPAPARREQWLFLMVVAAANASICSFFSGIDERYQARISWVITLYFIVWLISLAHKRNAAD